jgi:hypothetical protein
MQGRESTSQRVRSQYDQYSGNAVRKAASGMLIAPINPMVVIVA